MQQPMDSYISGINTSSESSILIRSCLLFMWNSGTPFLREK